MTDPDAPRLVLIVNPQSGKGRGALAGAQAEQLLGDAGAQVSVLRGSTAAHARSLAERAVQQHPDGVVVVGGDGTVTGIADLLADTGLPITLVPAGTGDDLARALGIPATIRERRPRQHCTGGPDASISAPSSPRAYAGRS